MLYVEICRDSCWVWTGPKDTVGYGKFWDNGKHWKAHRYLYTLITGEIKDGMFLCHRCDNPLCVRPDHMFVGFPKDNSQDMVAKGRQAKGSKAARAILSESDVIKIFQWKNGPRSSRDIGVEFGCHYGTIEAIWQGRNWNHLTHARK
jgi:hypothetical protein